ncbi:hypothetical protein [Nocardioides sp.]|uniref:hypothetical protein n=1 Tax=Nocardioides sp. TaxID=35761 RepID=UPI001A3192BD|nr:hypothetical protein [Nocardioides sp.]MBJ7359306.1 hypothetical protein [Nocardioides sp.]
MTTSSSAPARRVRGALAVIGAAAVIVGGVNVVAHAADKADTLLLGKTNKAEKSTTLKNTGKGPALKLKAKKGPALAVNTKDLVKNLNAELLGGSTAGQLEPGVTAHALVATGAALPEGPSFRQFQLPAGTYLMNLNLAVDTDNSDWFVGCLASEASVLTGSGNVSGVHVGLNMSVDSPAYITDSTRIVTLPTASNIAFGCVMSTSDTEPVTAAGPPTLTIRLLSGAVAGTSAPLAVSIRQAREAVRAVR